jgi:fatty-acid desaturase
VLVLATTISNKAEQNMKTVSSVFLYETLPIWFLGMISVVILIFLPVELTASSLSLVVVGWIMISGLGISIGYHRVFSHRSHNLPAWAEIFLLFVASFAGQNSSIVWSAIHRGYHHPFSDTEKDPHSPLTVGKLGAFGGWLFRPSPYSLASVPDLLKKPHHVWFHKYRLLVIWGVMISVAMYDVQMYALLLGVPMLIGSLQEQVVNVYGHSRSVFGYRNFMTRDNSYNNILLGYLAWGQGWHNNHHYSPKSYDFGRGVSGKKWEIDPCMLFKPVLDWISIPEAVDR